MISFLGNWVRWLIIVSIITIPIKLLINFIEDSFPKVDWSEFPNELRSSIELAIEEENCLSIKIINDESWSQITTDSTQEEKRAQYDLSKYLHKVEERFCDEGMKLHDPQSLKLKYPQNLTLPASSEKQGLIREYINNSE